MRRRRSEKVTNTFENRRRTWILFFYFSIWFSLNCICGIVFTFGNSIEIEVLISSGVCARVCTKCGAIEKVHWLHFNSHKTNVLCARFVYMAWTTTAMVKDFLFPWKAALETLLSLILHRSSTTSCITGFCLFSKKVEINFTKNPQKPTIVTVARPHSCILKCVHTWYLWGNYAYEWMNERSEGMKNLFDGI